MIEDLRIALIAFLIMVGICIAYWQSSTGDDCFRGSASAAGIARCK